MYDESVDDCLAVLKSIPDWFVKKKMLEKFHFFFFKIFFGEDFCKVIFFANEMGIFGVDLDNINLDDIHFYEDDPETIIHVSFLVWKNKFQKRKTLEKIYTKN